MSTPPLRKIALEEHFLSPELEREGLVANPGFAQARWDEILHRLADPALRLEEMDRHGVAVMVLSLASDGLQAQTDAARAVALATQANDALAAAVAASPDRLAGFAALPMQDPEAAAAELRRAVERLGFKGALVNGFSNLGDEHTAVYYDGEEYEPFWAEVERLGVPFYLHPRNPVLGQRRIYDGRPALLGPAWAFGVETGTHALRLIVSGLFDRFPALQIVLGHLGETLPFAINRLEQRMSSVSTVPLERGPVACLRENFHITTSGNSHTPSLIGALLEVGADRLLFSGDYPFEELGDGAAWFDGLPISAGDREKLGHENARRLLRL